jgi:hypothetical protein
VEASEKVEVKAYFEGVRNLLPSEDLSYGTVSGVGVYSGVGLYFVDFSEGKVYTNVEELNYRGALKTDYATNPVYALVMEQGDSLEVSFLAHQPLRAAALYLWGRAVGNGTVRIFLNGQMVFSGTVREGKIDPTDTQVIALGGQLELGRNRLNIMVESQSGDAAYVLQRLLIVF